MDTVKSRWEFINNFQGNISHTSPKVRQVFFLTEYLNVLKKQYRLIPYNETNLEFILCEIRKTHGRLKKLEEL
jgi:hypothetical protein